jgi:alpha-tubulin suppressor-like RCC1 family protein
MLAHPTIIEELRSQGIVIKDVACGVKHTAVLTAGTNKLICFGGNKFG